MTHWQTEQNRTHMKKYMRKNVMTRKQLKEFFGHPWKDQSCSKTTMTVNLELFKHIAYSDKNGQLCDIYPVEDAKDTDEIKKAKNNEAILFMSQHRGVPLTLLFA